MKLRVANVFHLHDLSVMKMKLHHWIDLKSESHNFVQTTYKGTWC